ncbi:SARP family transcriptional regulator [Solihabitans fulvus]|uniref:SARP family transcriptional regulator n=1 Tax=Solihabitans fulvus TaxID=1892852 RepID=A0A5B2WXX7_9PSEU|nr:BTAD domain-containing putative transcriptional regulator [Solihabitans fulvus]KAA2255356.1 SARP family transcriptional regulator [Solihabitans fulvus]
MAASRQDTSPVRFRLLGPVEFNDGGEWRSIGSAKQRTLLAILLLNANRVVPVRQLYAELWPDKPAAQVKGLLAGCVWRLRAALGETAGRALVTKASGYQFAVEPGALDVLEYEKLVTAARSRLAADDLAGAMTAFTAALRLWRGSPLADVALTLSVMAERARLEESRLTVLESRFGLQITLSDPEEVLPELKLIVSQHPLRERLHEHLMVALYRSGQQADALGAYRDLRRLLIDELGVEPSKPLRELQRRILAEDPQLAVALGTPAAPVPLAAPVEITRVAPHRLPPRNPVFVARDAEVAELTARLAEDNAVCAVHGMTGSGKTALALHVAQAVADRFPDGQLHLDLRGASNAPLDPAAALAALLSAFGERPSADPRQAAAQWAAALEGRRVLLVLDDLRDVRQVRPLLPTAPGCAVLLTGRAAVGAIDGCHHLRLGRLPVPAAVDLLRRVLGADRVDAQLADANTLAGLCECLPLAVRVAAARLAARPDWTIADLADRLADAHRRLDLLVSNDLSVRDRLQTCVHGLRVDGDEEALSALALLAELDLPVVTVATVAALLDVAEASAEATAERLVDAGLLESLPRARYRVPALVRLLAADELGRSEVAAPAAVQRVVDHYLTAVQHHLPDQSVSVRHEPGWHRGRATSLAWYREHHAILRALAHRDLTDTLPKVLDQLRWMLTN